MTRPSFSLRRVAASLVTVLLAGGLAALIEAPAAQAESLNVVANCSTLTVKPNGFAAKGEVRVLVDGEVQTDGTDDGWRAFKGSFSGVYAFDPTLAHDYTVEINSFGSDSASYAFKPGTGYDASYEGPTTPCSAVSVSAAASNCVSAKSIDKQSVNLTFSDLRRSVTYLAEVLLDNEVVAHFQFRTSPIVTKTFGGLTAGERYEVRLTDQSDDSLSARSWVRIPGCATRTTVSTWVQQCGASGQTGAISAAIGGLVSGRHYTVAVRPALGAQPTQTISGDSDDATVYFVDLPVSVHYSVSVSDDAAPRTTVSSPVQLTSCGTAATPPGVPGGATNGGSPGTGGQNTSAPTADGGSKNGGSNGPVSNDGTPGAQAGAPAADTSGSSSADGSATGSATAPTISPSAAPAVGASQPVEGRIDELPTVPTDGAILPAADPATDSAEQTPALEGNTPAPVSPRSRMPQTSSVLTTPSSAGVGIDDGTPAVETPTGSAPAVVVGTAADSPTLPAQVSGSVVSTLFLLALLAAGLGLGALWMRRRRHA